MEIQEKQVRYYQQESIDSVFPIIMENKDRYPIIALPTGTGKSFVFSLLIDKILSHNPSHNILILCDREQILKQDHEELEEYFGIDIGLYSKGRKSTTIEKITVAGIQSVWRKPHLFSHFDFVIIDECDSINENEKSMYRSFLSEINAVYVGATATPYGLKGGFLHEGENSLFTEICIDYTRGENYNKLVKDGFLPQIFSRPTSVKFDETKLSTIAGDFSLKDQSENFDVDPITRAAMIETVFYGKKFNRWLLFAIDIKHAENISRILSEMGISNCVIHSKMEKDRDVVLAESRTGKYRAIINVDVLTIGYNDPDIDLIGLYFCTKSPRKHVQTVGRFRSNPNTPFKLVLDFGGNFARLGPLNDVLIKPIKKKKGEVSEPMMKICPECGMYCYLSAKNCENCDFEFPVKNKIQKADLNAEVIRTVFEKPKEKENKGLRDWVKVSEVRYSRHSKAGSPDGVLVEYKSGFLIFKDYVNIEHSGYPAHLAKNWIDYRWEGTGRAPRSVSEFLENKHLFSKPVEICVDTSGKYKRVVDCKF